MGASLLEVGTYELRSGDALQQLRLLPDASIQTCLTSPPYFALRKYSTAPQVWGGDANCSHELGLEIPGDARGGSGPKSKEKRSDDSKSSYGRNATRGRFCGSCGAWEGELGLEPTPALFVEHLVLICREIRRVLRDDGTFFLNIADTFYSGALKGHPDPWKLKKKDLCGVPHRLVTALQEDGWYWRTDGIWSKAGGNCPRCHFRIEKGSTKPESVKDRFTRSHEYLFLLTKSPNYYFDVEAVKAGHTTSCRRDVFHISSQNFRGAHHATMPEALAEVGILGGTSEHGACAKCQAPYKRITQKGELDRKKQKEMGSDASGDYKGENLKDYEGAGAEKASDLKRRILAGARKTKTVGWAQTCKCVEPGDPIPCLVLDPFSGAATTGAVALRYGQRYLGIELLETNNVEIAKPRLDAELEALKAPVEIDYLPLTSGLYHGASEILLHRVVPNSVRLILTDPPYNVSQENNFHTMGRTGINFAWDGGFDQELWIRLADKALMPGGSIVIWNDWKVLGLIAHLLIDLGYAVKRPLTWIKCLSGSTRVYARTKKGDIPITVKDLVRCDPESVQLWTGENWSQAVGWTQNLTPEAPVEITLRSGEVIKCTANHRWPTVRGLLPTEELKVGDVLLSTRLSQPEQPVEPAALDDELVGWFVGLYIAEGSRGEHKASPKLQIAGHVDEDDRHQRLAEIAAAFHGTLNVYNTHGKGVSANLTSKILNAIIDTYVAGKDAYTKRLKGAAWQRSDAFLGAVLSGYLEGDGHFDAGNDRFRLGFTRRNKCWANDLRCLAARLGASLRLRPGTSTCDDKEYPTWRGDLRYDPSRRKTSDTEIMSIRACRWGGNFWDISIEDEPHLFALASGVLTHNSNPWPRNQERVPVQRIESGLWAVKPGGKWVQHRRPHHAYEDLIFHYAVPQITKAEKAAGRIRHDTKKPDDMFREIIQIFSDPGDLILDPFAGGGTTAYAAEAEGRRHISFELDLENEGWIKEAADHWERGKTAPPLVFPTTPEEKARAAFKGYRSVCKKLQINPVTFERVPMKTRVVKDDTNVEESVSYQILRPPTDVGVRDYKHVVKLKEI